MTNESEMLNDLLNGGEEYKKIENFQEMRNLGIEYVTAFKQKFPSRYKVLFEKHYGFAPSDVHLKKTNPTEDTFKNIQTLKELFGLGAEAVTEFRQLYPVRYAELYKAHYGIAISPQHLSQSDDFTKGFKNIQSMLDLINLGIEYVKKFEELYPDRYAELYKEFTGFDYKKKS